MKIYVLTEGELAVIRRLVAKKEMAESMLEENYRERRLWWNTIEKAHGIERRGLHVSVREGIVGTEEDITAFIEGLKKETP